MAGKSSAKKTWGAILVAAIAIVCVLVVALIGGSAYFIARHVSSQFVSAESADAQFMSARQRLVGQTPLIEMQIGDEPILHRPAADAHRPRIEVLHALIYSTEAGKLVDVSLPMWLLRMSPGNHLSFLDDNAQFDSGRVHLTLEDVERHGPGLILDATDRRGARVLIWAE